MQHEWFIRQSRAIAGQARTIHASSYGKGSQQTDPCIQTVTAGAWSVDLRQKESLQVGICQWSHVPSLKDSDQTLWELNQ